MHCNTEYPTPFNDVNLNVIGMLKKRFKYPIGYSDHTLGIIIANRCSSCWSRDH